MTSAGDINRLACYGTLQPGRSNHNQLSALKGEWSPGTVNGTLVSEGWAFEQGYPAIVLDPQAPSINVQVFESEELTEHWPRLDEFEGPSYRRVLTDVRTASETIRAWIYVFAQ